PRRRLAGPPLRRALVRDPRRHRGRARPRRRPVAARPARRRHGELLRLRAVEHLADRLRGRDPRARAARQRRGGELRAGGGDVVRAGDGRRWIALGVLCLSLLAIVIDNTIVNVALPTLVRELDADIGELQWVVDAYTLVFAGLLLLAGALGDRYGRRRTLLAGLVVFGGASAVALTASSASELIFLRGLIGLGAALVMPATLSTITGTFPPAERTRAVSV